MELFVALIAGIVSVLLMAIELCFLLHAILSWFADEGNALYRFIGMVTEPFVRPIRALLVKMNWLQNTPMDFSYLIAYFLISILSLFLA